METTIREACLVVGYVAAVVGLWMIWPPLAPVLGGAALVWVGLPAAPKGGDRA